MTEHATLAAPALLGAGLTRQPGIVSPPYSRRGVDGIIIIDREGIIQDSSTTCSRSAGSGAWSIHPWTSRSATWSGRTADVTSRSREHAGIDRISCTDLRRTYASWLEQRGVDSLFVARLLGHTSTRRVDAVYGQLDDPTSEPAVGLLPAPKRSHRRGSKWVAASCIATDTIASTRRKRPSQNAGSRSSTKRSRCPGRSQTTDTFSPRSRGEERGETEGPGRFSADEEVRVASG